MTRSTDASNRLISSLILLNLEILIDKNVIDPSSIGNSLTVLRPYLSTSLSESLQVSSYTEQVGMGNRAFGISRLVLALFFILFELEMCQVKAGRVGVSNKIINKVQRHAPSRVLVHLKPANSSSASTLLNSKAMLRGLRFERSISLQAAPSRNGSSLVSTHVFTISDGSSVQEKLDHLLSFPEVEIAEPDYIVGVNRVPNDPSYVNQWHHPKISSPTGWGLSIGSKQVKVCVIDSGVRIDHPDVIDNVLGGWNLVPNSPQDLPPTEGDPLWYNFNDTLGHGTHVSGLIAAMGNNARGVSGAAWRMGLISCKFISDAGSGYISDAITCMQLCQAEGALILSNSWGGMQTPSNVLLTQIQSVGSAGILFVAAAGNSMLNVDTSPVYPSGYRVDNLVSVAATTQSDTLADFSNYGANTIHLAAPGVNLLSTTHDTNYGYMSGTSMAAPLVSGAAALLQAMSLEATNTSLAPLALRQLLVDSVDPIPGGSAKLISGGRLNLGRAVQTLAQQLGSKYKQLPPPEMPPPTSSPLPQMATPTATGAALPPQNPLNNVTAQLKPPECGTSMFRGALAEQSSTYLGRVAAYAVNGDCRNDPLLFPTACASTDPQDNYPWWQGKAKNNVILEINAVSITTRADCCWNAVLGAQVFVGFGIWNGTSQNNSSTSNFSTCGEVPITGVLRGQRITVDCSRPMNGTTIVVFLPKLQTSLTLCEVDLTVSNSYLVN